MNKTTRMRTALAGDTPALGGVFALSAFSIWGFFPLFFKLFEGVSAFDVLAHRVVWSVLFVSLALLMRRRWRTAAGHVRDWKKVRGSLLSGLAIAANWGIFIWAVGHDQVLEGSLGYFINPLVSVILAVIFLGERLRPWQWFSVALAGVGVFNMVVSFGAVPWVALSLALTFGSYGLLRKIAPVNSLDGLFLETLFLSPMAVAYLVWLAIHGEGAFVLGNGPWGGLSSMDVFLILSGVVTALPLLLFARAAKLIRLSTLGLVQYLVPTLQFSLAVFVFKEPFGADHLITFVLIWVALAIFSIDAMTHRRPVT
ncbi:EamA family transporter RarD [Varunaivibrio sulfuroxidans]|uniref:Chloramphenicol-sensitive protein RarD n=1 Tax=Varunaivibrio sulfuroxidans TaxID=1773489 RepID=A0A4R3JFA6_9PROT|nr:EamA family transporter RarD [Varunaivibrio sulfuroxidans]TCS64809.1 chloramphenicol-sensitive protein RarD [Varunaivibrio sulfuroxidans]WES29890.1 EamA family transporter RarD [Varunaivibrio sulfuroxidans]